MCKQIFIPQNLNLSTVTAVPLQIIGNISKRYHLLEYKRTTKFNLFYSPLKRKTQVLTTLTTMDRLIQNLRTKVISQEGAVYGLPLFIATSPNNYSFHLVFQNLSFCAMNSNGEDNLSFRSSSDHRIVVVQTKMKPKCHVINENSWDKAN